MATVIIIIFIIIAMSPVVSTRACQPGLSIATRPKSRKPRAGIPGAGHQPPPHQLGGLEERCELPRWGSGQSAPDRPKVFHHFQHSRWPLLTQPLRGGKTPVIPCGRSATVTSNAVVFTITIRFRFDDRSTAYQRSLRS